MSRLALPTLGLLTALLGCETARTTNDGVADETSGTSESTDTGDASEGETASASAGATETGDPPCDPDECTPGCADLLSPCGGPMTGACTDEGGCNCAPIDECPPCDSAQCGPWESCSAPTGVCKVGCFYEFEPILDPPGSCEIPLVDLPEWVEGSLSLRFDGVTVPQVDDCATLGPGEPGWMWIPDPTGMRLCETSCAAFAAAETVSAGWSIPCE